MKKRTDETFRNQQHEILEVLMLIFRIDDSTECCMGRQKIDSRSKNI